MRFKYYRYQVVAKYDKPEFRQDLESIARDQGRVISSLKEDTTASVWRTDYQSRPLVVKRFNTQGIWHAIRRLFRQSRADNCWRMTTAFSRAGIGTPPNVAVIQEWVGPCKLRSWFVSEFIEGEMLIHYFTEQTESTRNNYNPDALKSDISKLFEDLRTHFLSHGDLKASNILLSKDTLFLIDLDAARTHKNKRSFERAHNKDRARFLKNWLQQTDIYKSFEPLVNQHYP